MWDVLAIAPTDDPKVIRRAYAARLRQMDPDREREAFAQLREALEWALARATQPPRRASERTEPVPEPVPEPVRDPAPADEVPPIVVETRKPPQARYNGRYSPAAPSPPAPRPPPVPPAPGVAEERARERALLIALESALQRCDAREAAQLYFRAAATGALPLGDAERMLARLFTAALEDKRLDPQALRGLARSFGWDKPMLDSAAVSDVRQRVSARLAAEDWYDTMVASAAPKWLVRSGGVRAARLILGRIRGRGLLRIDRQALRIYLDQHRRHEVWLRDRIPPDWVATLDKRMRQRELVASVLITLFVGSLLLEGVVGVIGAAFKEGLSWAMLVFVALAAFLVWILKHLVKNFLSVWRQRPG